MIQLNGFHVVADPAVCHGEPTFRGTRILVRDVVEQVAMGLDWDTICQQWRGAITKEAISEAIRLAGQSLQNHADRVKHAAP